MPRDHKVAIVGVGITKHSFFPEKSWRRMVFESAYAALDDARMEPGEIEGGFISVTAPEICEQQNMGALVADELGMVPSGFSQIVQACAGGAVGLRNACMMIMSGMFKRVLVVGIEKISDSMATAEVLLGNLDVEYEYPLGYDYIDMMALMQTRYMSKYKVSERPFAQVAVQDRWYATKNPKAIDYGRPETNIKEIL